MKYRREIDGLRAVAVLPVIFFHAGFELFSGGFVGVDIFFIISGYLITTIILADKEKGTFSLVEFYERRARRILPALFFVMFCCLPFAWYWLLPDYLESFSRSLVAVSGFASNLLFWSESGYFATVAELKPLLHTWSLAVEEQYYVLFPLYILLLWKLRKRWLFGSLVVVAVVSLLLAQWGAYHKPSATFYLLPTRAWELAVGALLAFYFLYKRKYVDLVVSNRAVSELGGLLGVFLICYSILAFDKATPFPSFYALIPTVGTALIIVFTTPQTIVGRLLGSRVMVGVGLISYSTYLWHQPLFVFARHRSLTDLSNATLLVLSALSIIFAYFSWRFVEVPFRNRDVFSRKSIFGFAILGSVGFVVIGLSGYLNSGWPSRLHESTLIELGKASKSTQNQKDTNWLARKNNFIAAEDSFMTPANADKYAYLVGDSHAEALAEELRKAFERSDVGFMALTYEGCPPITGVYRVDEKDDHKCYEYNNNLSSYISENDNIEYVILHARWALYLEGLRFDNGDGGKEKGHSSEVDLVVNGNKSRHEDDIRREKVISAYVDTVEGLLKMGKKVILVYSTPETGWYVGDYIYKSSFIYDLEIEKMSPKYGSTSHDKFIERQEGVYMAFDSIGDHPDLFRVMPENIFCNSYVDDRCVVQNNGEIFYRDNNHLSFSGAKLVVDEIMKYIQ